jgi:ABC-type lipoprotein export system ATPase subunit
MIDDDHGATMSEPTIEIIDLPSAERQARRQRPRYGERALIVCDNLVKIYKVADLEVVALQGLDLLVESGEFIALTGASGSGKSTLLNILGGLDVPSAGRAVVAGRQLEEIGPREQTRYLRHIIGFVWQQTSRNLVPYLSALENVALPMVFDGVPAASRDQAAHELLAMVGLGDRAAQRPEQMSGGEQQRVAIAVALANQPEVLLADEPTGELDTDTAHEIFALFRRLNRELGVTIVVATHDPVVSNEVDRTVAIRDGRVASEVLRQRSITAAGEHHVVATEYAVLDRAGRLQLPRAHVEALGLERRVRLELEPDHIGIWPDRPGDEPTRPLPREDDDAQPAAPPVARDYRRPEARVEPRRDAADDRGRDAADDRGRDAADDRGRDAAGAPDDRPDR